MALITVPEKVLSRIKDPYKREQAVNLILGVAPGIKCVSGPRYIPYTTRERTVAADVYAWYVHYKDQGSLPLVTITLKDRHTSYSYYRDSRELSFISSDVADSARQAFSAQELLKDDPDFHAALSAVPGLSDFWRTSTWHYSRTFIIDDMGDIATI